MTSDPNHDRAVGAAPLAVYTLHRSHRRYGGESMALATLDGLRRDYRVLLLAPPGVGHERAAALGIPSQSFNGEHGLAAALTRILARERRLAFLTTSVEHSLIAGTLNLAFRRRLAHLHVAHGGPEPMAYRRKRLLNRFNLRFVAVSEYAKERLVAFGARPERIVVIDNFLSRERGRCLDAASHPLSSVRRVLSIMRLEPLKRPGLILDAIERRPELAGIRFRILGDGELAEPLRQRAQALGNVELPGFSYDIESELKRADLLLHPCPVEAFGLVVLEAMTAGVPVLVPDRGGAGDIVTDGVTGFHFRADDPEDLADRLLEVIRTPAERLTEVAANARRHALQDYSQEYRCAQYRDLIEELLAPPMRPLVRRL